MNSNNSDSKTKIDLDNFIINPLLINWQLNFLKSIL